MFDEKKLYVKKNPYMALSSSFIEYFAIIGYKDKTVPKILDSYKTKNNIYKPTIISSITSKVDYGLIDNKLIISQIYPDNPLTIFIEPSSQISSPPGSKNIIYSFCFDSTDGKEKIFYVCYAFKFYEKYRYEITANYYEEYYIPKAFCIISQYYYFSIFEYICRNVYKIFENHNNKIPLEIIVYNIVNFIPSPMNNSIQLYLFSQVLDEDAKKIIQMSGYPYLEFDLSEIFNLMPLNLVLEIYILTFLELSIIFFCSDLELLNMVMFIMFVLNYPCNDSPYYWHVVSVSKDNFVGENQFVGKFMVSFVGVNYEYNSNFNTEAFGKFHYIVDLDNKKSFLIDTDELDEESDIKDFQNMKDIQTYIQNILKDNKVESGFLKNDILKLKKNLESILTTNPDFNPNAKNKYVNFFKISNSILNKNKSIQEIFYDFNINILMLLFQDYSLNNSFTEIKKEDLSASNKKITKIISLDSKAEISKEENIFLKLYRNSSKYGLYFENFVRNFETLDVLTVPLLFSEEFINQRINLIKNKSNNKISFFNIMDLLFLSERPQTISTLNNITSIYGKKFDKYFKIFKKPKNDKNSRLISFSKTIINRYIYLLNNTFNEEEILDLFPYLRIQLNSKLASINRKYIINTIIEYLENKEDIISTTNLLIFSCVYVFAISISLHSYQRIVNYINDITKTLKNADILIRHYVFIIIKVFYKYYLLNEKSNSNSIKMYIFMLLNFLNDNLIVPNEEMMKNLNSFFIITQEQEDKEKITGRKSIDMIKDNYIDIKKEKNIICFMRYCFTYKTMFKPNNMVSAAMKEKNVCNMLVKIGNKSNQPLIVLKIKEYVNSVLFYSPKKIYKLMQSIYNDYFDKYELDLNKLNIVKLRECITNLVLYGMELNKNQEGLIPLDLLVNTLYLLKDYKENEMNEKINKELDKNIK